MGGAPAQGQTAQRIDVGAVAGKGDAVRADDATRSLVQTADEGGSLIR
jgi:hypothetical protein